MAGRFLDKPLYRVVALGIEKRSRDTHVADIALEDESGGLRADLFGTKRLSSPAAPKGYLRLGAHIENPGHHSVWRHEPPLSVGLDQNHWRRPLLTCSTARGGEAVSYTHLRAHETVLD